MTADELVGSIRFPEEWVDAPWRKADILAVLTIKRTGKQICVAGGALETGCLLYGLSFPGGHRVMRCSPDTDWAIEERFTGRAPKKDRSIVEDVWKRLLDSFIASKQEAERVLGKPPERGTE